MSKNTNSGIFVTASQLYNFMVCPHRVWRDVHGPQEEQITEINPFVQLLWDKGIQHEQDIIKQIGEYVDLSKGSFEERFSKTKSAIESRAPLIYQGVLIHNNLLGIPDILQHKEDATYIPIEIKSGRGLEGTDDSCEESSKPKKTYAVQLALYIDLLNKLGYLQDRKGLVIDINATMVEYDLDQQIGARDHRSHWELYLETKASVSDLLTNKVSNTPASCGGCKLCSWHNSCMKWVDETDDLTGLFGVGRSKRDTLLTDIAINTIQDVLSLDINQLLETKNNNKSFLKGIGQKTLEQILTRADVVKNLKEPVIYGKIDFPRVSYELYFDIEDDPTQNFVYMHGIYEKSIDGYKYIDFTAREIGSNAEMKAWSDFWNYIDSLPVNDYAVYYFSSHEKTTYRRLQRSYPEVILIEKLEDFFNNPNVIDLYNVVSKYTDWPISSYSLKSLAMYIGFKWRDESPSGALSIQWFSEYLETGDEKILERILLYNEDDCKATMVLKDKLKELSDSLQ